MTRRSVKLIAFLPPSQHAMYAAIKLPSGQMVASAVIAFGTFTVTKEDEDMGIDTYLDVLPICAALLGAEGTCPEDYGTPYDDTCWSVHASSLIAHEVADKWNLGAHGRS